MRIWNILARIRIQPGPIASTLPAAASFRLSRAVMPACRTLQAQLGIKVSITNFVVRVACAATLLLALHGTARADDVDAQTAWRLLDYIAVDYAGAVEHGKIVSESEYAEQVEFAATVAARIGALPEHPARADLLGGVAQLQAAIARKADAAQVATQARALGAALLAAYPVAVAPARVPDPALGTRLYAQQCASCHGANGDGHGPAAAALSPAPIAFDDTARARQRSLLALYQTITQGVDGTSMPGFAQLSNDERWALAFHVGQLAFAPAQVAKGEALWQADANLRARIPDLKALTQLTPATFETEVGATTADAITAWLRSHPDTLQPKPGAGTLALARERLAQSLAAYREGDRRKANQLALSAYLDGFEPIEPTLAAHDGDLLTRVESAMAAYRSGIAEGEDATVLAQRVASLDGLIGASEAALAGGSGGQLASFLGALTILLREGLEALLIVVAMLAFLRKAERVEVVRYVHAGWIGALLAGGLTWAAATWLIEISGASRELTEGFGSVFAALVLVSVGIWMHGKAQADHWQRYIREKMSRALSGRAAWLLFGLAFLVVYREVFETILFFAALWSQGNGAALLAGAGSAIVLLGLIAMAMLRFSRMLPLATFFRWSAWLMAVLAVVLAGKGVAALQEAGMVGVTQLAGLPRVGLFGLFPTVQTTLAQVLTLLALLAGFAWNRRGARHA